MILVKINHYLNQEGLTYFHTWFDEVAQYMKTVDGFLDIAYRCDTDTSNAKIFVFFENNNKLTQWAASKQHSIFMKKLDPFRTKPWNATREEMHPQPLNKT